MKISVHQVVKAAECRLAAVTAEAAGFIVLEAARWLQTHSSPFRGMDLLLNEQGQISFDELEGQALSDEAAETELLQLLGTLLRQSRSVPPALSSLSSRSSKGDLPALEGALLAALIPFNPAAARRGLARLYREVSRAAAVVTPPAAAVAPPGATALPTPITAPEPASSSPVSCEPFGVGEEPAESPETDERSPEVACTARAASDVSECEELDIHVEFDARRASSLPAPPSCNSEKTSPGAGTEQVRSSSLSAHAADVPSASGVESAQPTSPSIQPDLALSVEQPIVTPSAPPLEACELSPTPRSAVRVTLPMPDPSMRESERPTEPVQLELFSNELVADEVDALLSTAPPLVASAHSATRKPVSLLRERLEVSDTTPCTAPPVLELNEVADRRSNLEELMNEFLSHTRSEQFLSANLREMIGIGAPPAKTGS